jgi:Cell division protein CrgA
MLPAAEAGPMSGHSCRYPSAWRVNYTNPVPKSRVRSKAVYTPPPRSAKAKVSPPWLVPTMLGSLIIGLVWIVVFYVSQQSYPISALGAWNLVVGFVFLIGGVVLSTRWR